MNFAVTVILSPACHLLANSAKTLLGKIVFRQFCGALVVPSLGVAGTFFDFVYAVTTIKKKAYLHLFPTVPHFCRIIANLGKSTRGAPPNIQAEFTSFFLGSVRKFWLPSPNIRAPLHFSAFRRPRKHCMRLKSALTLTLLRKYVSVWIP